MQARRITIGLMLAAGLFFTGCGGAEMAADAEPGLATREDATWLCDGSVDYYIYYYSDAALTQWVGTEACSCDGTYSFVGNRALYRESRSFSCN
jgi:hypothetical protein